MTTASDFGARFIDAYEWVQNLPINNAWLLGVRRYNLELDVFQDLFTATGEDWTVSLQLFRAAAAESDPYAYLRTWLATANGAHGGEDADPDAP